MYSIVITKSAKKDIESLEVHIKVRLKKKLLYFASLNDIHTVSKRLESSVIGDYRIRIGDYRVIFDLDDFQIVILRVQHRKDVYR